MNIISFATKELITKVELEEIFNNAGLNYKLGGVFPFEEFWIPDNDDKAIFIVYINDLDEKGFSNTESEFLKDFNNLNIRLPKLYKHILCIESRNAKIFDKFVSSLLKLYPEVYYYDDKKDEFIKL